MEILKVKNLCKNYGKGNTLVKALDNISFSVEKGEFVAIVGASGSGKSTLLHLLGGVDRPTSGEIIIDGENVYKAKDIEEFEDKIKGILEGKLKDVTEEGYKVVSDRKIKTVRKKLIQVYKDLMNNKI